MRPWRVNRRPATGTTQKSIPLPVGNPEAIRRQARQEVLSELSKAVSLHRAELMTRGEVQALIAEEYQRS